MIIFYFSNARAFKRKEKTIKIISMHTKNFHMSHLSSLVMLLVLGDQSEKELCL